MNMTICRECKVAKPTDRMQSGVRCQDCVNRYYREKRARERVAGPCHACGNPLPKWKQLYCSSACRRRAAYARNPDRFLEKAKAARERDPERFTVTGRRAYARKKDDPAFRLNGAMSSALYKSLNGSKQGGWRSYVDFTIGELKRHLEARFEPEMNWSNYGTEWHIDHIVPKSSFAFASRHSEEFRACWSLENLMPRWATTEIAKTHGSTQLGNINKGAKLPEEVAI